MSLLATIAEIVANVLPFCAPNPEASAPKRFQERYGIDAYGMVLGVEPRRFLDAALAMPGWSWTLKVKSCVPDRKEFIVAFTDDGPRHGLLHVDLSQEGGQRYRLQHSSTTARHDDKKQTG